MGRAINARVTDGFNCARELAARREEVTRDLERSLANLLAPEKDGDDPIRWICAGEEQKIHSRRQLNNLLSNICDSIFSDAPTIQNEIINRRELSSSAAAGQGELLKAMVRNADKEGLAIEGYPPERSIYMSVLKQLGLHQQHGDRWLFASGLKGIDESAKATVKAIGQFFDQAQDELRTLDSLFTLLREPPFGIRDGVIPIFVCAALLARDAEIALYEGGAFLPEITEPVLEKLVKRPEHYSIRRWHVSGVRSAVFEQLAEMLERGPAPDRIERRDILDVVKPLLKFVRRLNEFCNSTRSFTPVAVAVRDTLKHASEPDQLLFKDLPVACGLAAFASKTQGRNIDVTKYRKTLEAALSEIHRGYDHLLQSLQDELASCLDATSEDTSVRHGLMRRAKAVLRVALNPDSKVFCARLADEAPDDGAWIESVASFLVNKHPAQWIDDDRGRFSVRLTQVAAAFRSLEGLVHAREQSAIASEDESIQLAVVGTHSGEAQRVVHITRQDHAKVNEMLSKLQSLVADKFHNGERRVVLAAVARLVHVMLSDDTFTINQSLGGER